MAHGNVPVKHSAGQKSGAVPDLASGFSKRRVKSRTANCDVKAMIEQTLARFGGNILARHIRREWLRRL
jgi:hypothetical protein